jgi:hypothetical protein
MAAMDIVLAAWTPDKTRAALRFVDALAPRLPGGGRRLIVCNSPAVREAAWHPGWEALDGSNTLGEFSAWQEGLDHLGAVAGGGVLFLNDTVVAHRRFSTFRRWAFVHEVWRANPRCVVGFVVHSEHDIGDLRIDGLMLPGWFSTWLFWMGSETLARLEHRLWEPASVDACVRGGADEASFFTERVSPDLQRQMRAWLFEGGWYRSEPLSAATSPWLARKARAICAELLLSARCWTLGCTRHDPFERHPLARHLDVGSENWVRRLHLSRAPWTRHPVHWSRRVTLVPGGPARSA